MGKDSGSVTNSTGKKNAGGKDGGDGKSGGGSHKAVGRIGEEEQREFVLLYSTLERLRQDLWMLLEVSGDGPMNARLGHDMEAALNRTKTLIKDEADGAFRSAQSQLAHMAEHWGDLKASDAALLLGMLTETLCEFRERHCGGVEDGEAQNPRTLSLQDRSGGSRRPGSSRLRVVDDWQRYPNEQVVGTPVVQDE